MTVWKIIGIDIIVTFLACLFSYKNVFKCAKELASWKDEFDCEFDEQSLSKLDTVSGINDFYFMEGGGKNPLETKFLLKRKSYLLSKIEDCEVKKNFLKRLIPILTTGGIPQVIALVLPEIGVEELEETRFGVFIILCLYLSLSLWIVFKELCEILASSKTAPCLKDEYELKCINKLINNSFENN